MATSGLLLVAKSKAVHKHLQAQFKDRSIKKRYVAVLDGELKTDEGIVDLPVCVDIHNRPRQIVSDEYGKSAITQYRVLERGNAKTRIEFYPQTGRTHQLRIHAAHERGLNCPIVGDELYGKKSDRLYLHAECLEFQHPISGERICVEKKSDF
jgi:tRNA pseudouridine32 synthase/23S rRNA pseudouridine746 synthase